MRDERIEEMLREAWKPAMPEGMRERVLLQARSEVNKLDHASTRQGRMRWRLLLAAISVSVALTANMLDSFRFARVAALVDGNGGGMAPVSVPVNVEQNRETERLLALSTEFNLASNLREKSYDLIHSF